MPSLFEIMSPETRTLSVDVPLGAPALADATSSLHAPLTAPQMGVSLLRKYAQFQTAARNLLADARKNGSDPLDGLHTAIQRLLSGKTKPPMRLSDLADYEDGQNVAVRCKEIATDILKAIYPVSSARDDASELDALHRALEPKSIHSRLLREPGQRAGYRVHVSKLAGALAQLEAMVTETALEPPHNAVPNALLGIVADRLMSFRAHICESNMGMFIAVRYQPRDVSDYLAEPGWAVVRRVKVEGFQDPSE